jgi:TerB-C domain
MDHAANLLLPRNNLDAEQSRRLQSLAQILLLQQTKSSQPRDGARNDLNAEQQNLIGRFLVAVAGSHGRIERDTASALRKAFATLGMDAALLKRQIAEHRKGGQEPVEVERAGQSHRSGEPIPPRAQSTLGALLLNDDRIRNLLEETQDVARILAEIMLEEWPGEPSPSSGVEPESAMRRTNPDDPVAPWLEGLDRRYASAVVELSERSAWLRPEFAAIARRHQLMPSSLFDVVNEWAIEVFGDMLVEERGDEVLFHKVLITVPR